VRPATKVGTRESVRVVGSYVSPYVRKVLVVLDLKGIPYEIDPIIPFMGNDASPIRRIPVLTDDQITLTDSTVICEYLDDRHPELPVRPSGAVARARARWLEEFADTRMGEVDRSLRLGCPGRSGDRRSLPSARRRRDAVS